LRLSWQPKHDRGRSGQAEAEITEENVTDNTITLDAEGLEPLTTYDFEVVSHAGEVVGRGGFETAPDGAGQTPEKFSFAVMSCNQPFNRNGRVYPGAGQMLEAAKQWMADHSTKFALMVGDQMYSDFPEPLSLFDEDYFKTIAPEGRNNILECNPAEVRAIFQRRYRHFWNQKDWMSMQAHIPCYPILDDHDIVDNWGSREDHQEPRWRSLGRGAMMAYHDYQGSRVNGNELPYSFQYGFAYGNTAVYVMDIRSERRAGYNGRLFSDNQQADVENFLAEHGDKAVMCMVLSVPIVHLPRFLAKMVAALPRSGEDFSDRWSTGKHINDRDTLLKIIHAHQRKHPEQKFLLLSGDIHIGCVHSIQWEDGTPALYQLISSPITHHTSLPLQWASKAIIRMNKEIATQGKGLKARVSPLKGINKDMKNPFGKLNMGLVEIETPRDGGPPGLRIMFYGHEGGNPALRFDSGLMR
jgi:alkaline phosphatase D